MPQDFLANAPGWAVGLFWAAFAVFAALFGAVVPKLRSALARVAPVEPQPDLALRTIGAALGNNLDAVKVGEQLERIGDHLETIADAAKSLARSEETGQARMLEQIADKLSRLEERR